MGLEDLKASQAGPVIEAILTDPRNIAAMVAVSEHAEAPAVQAVGKQLVSALGPIEYETRKAIGRWVAEVMAKEGWKPSRRGRVREGYGFTRGMVYVRN